MQVFLKRHGSRLPRDMGPQENDNFLAYGPEVPAGENPARWIPWR
ncbi:hypothetical protein [Delftia acidovorans]